LRCSKPLSKSVPPRHFEKMGRSPSDIDCVAAPPILFAPQPSSMLALRTSRSIRLVSLLSICCMTLWRSSIAAVACALLSGCHLLDEPATSKPILAAAKSSPGSVTLEVFFARFPFKSPLANESLWKQVDEQSLPSELRQELAENGFRAGIVGTSVPAELAELLKLHDKQSKQSDEQGRTTLTAEQLEVEPSVTLRVLNAPAGHRCELLTSHNYESLSLLTLEDSDVRGKTYHNADGRFALKASPLDGQQVYLELVPELHHGQQKLSPISSDGIIRMETARPKRMFEQLKIETSLGAGQMLLVTSLPERLGSVGHYFFTQPSGESLTQKLLVIRVAHCGEPKRDDADNEPKVLDVGVSVQE
jgi:hypothetical protein